MVSFRSLVAGAALMAAPAMAALTPAQIIDGLNSMTTKSNDALPDTNAPGEGPYPKVLENLHLMVQDAHTMISQQPGTATIIAEAQEVSNAFSQFVGAQQGLLNQVGALFQNAPITGQPVAAVLRHLESAVDRIAIFLIDTVQSRAVDIQSNADDLSVTFSESIKALEGVAPVARDARVFVA